MLFNSTVILWMELFQNLDGIVGWLKFIKILNMTQIYMLLLKAQPLPEKIQDDIKKDQNRTFTRHSYFKDPNKGQEQLYSVLHALSIQYPEIGYAQGMNFVVGFCLIMSGGNEEDVFWFINFINQNERFNWWEIYRGEFTFAQNLCQIFQENLQRQLPQLFNHFQKNGIFAFQYFWQWILTQFLYSFPIEIVIFFWDFILATDIYSILKIGLAFLRDMENILIGYDLTQLSEYFSYQTKKQNNIDITDLLNKAKNIEITMSEEQKTVNANCKPKTLK
ncbi:unnamed protein product (macronuclear) [Paramecium tetraurelia]|uniref:Rab-GAP TBC domain-containing protein n=1 Tax=Paramecium tetraurelia TaxID=5888 RepID=A0CUC2_PARTE|nr:uncharacterized protein GSPATT00010589001 [Paramecium tetraurelia]CAK74389.1 unnamed protein product [Paramecium tetraurelia]|eukprot:XP_001441786.1 hypothetical protein (macronuclear) [Paramecium tetraurelia strain d4-2]